MTALLFLPIVLSLFALGAHFLRAGSTAIVAAIILLLALLFVRRPWAARVVQAALVLGALEWLRTLLRLAGERMRAGESVMRLVVILGVVAGVTALSALAFQTRTLGQVYRLPRPSGTTTPDEPAGTGP